MRAAIGKALQWFGRKVGGQLSVLYEGGHPKDPALARLFGGGATVAGVEVTEETSLTLSAVFAAVRIYSESIGSLPLNVYRPSGKRREIEYGGAVHRMLHTSPNPQMTSMVARETMEAHRQLWGNAYAEIVWNPATAEPLYYYPVEPWRVQVKRDEGSRSIYYLVDGKRRVESDDMLHVPGLGFDGLVGKGVITIARESMGYTLATQRFGTSFYANNARPGGVLEHPGNLSDKGLKHLEESWMKNRSGPENAGKVYIAEEGMKYTPLTMPLDDAQFLETRQFQITEVARWFNIPPHLLRDLTNATYSNIEQQGIDFVTNSLRPVLVRWEQEYDRKLLADDTGRYTKHVVEALLRGDMTSQGEFLSKLFSVGGMQINEIRDKFDMDPVADGDTTFVPVNMVPLERAINPPEPPKHNSPTPSPNDPTPNSPTPKNGDPSQGDAGNSTESQSQKVLPNTLLSDAQQQLTQSVLGRIIRKEAMAASRAAKKPNEFLSWLDSFYADHEDDVRRELRPVVAVMLAVENRNDVDPVVERFTKRHIEASRADMLTASECTPTELPARVESVLAAWQLNRITLERDAA